MKLKLAALPGAPKFLDSEVPIREGKGRVDCIAALPPGELLFIWFRQAWTVQAVGEMIPDYLWVRSNLNLWCHYYPQAMERGQLRVQAWGVGQVIDPEVEGLLASMAGLRLRILQADAAAPLAPRRPRLVPRPPLWSPAPMSPASTAARVMPPPFLSEEEIRDLVKVAPPATPVLEDEITEPLFEALP